MKTLRTFGLLALLAVTARGDDWSHSGRDDARNRAPSETVDTPALFASAVTGSETVASPAAADGYIVTAGLDGNIRAYRESDLSLLWTAPRVAAVLGSPQIRLGRVYIPFADGTLKVLRLADGADLGSVQTGGAWHSSPLLSNGRLYVGAGFPGNTLQAYAVDAGATSWSAPLSQVVDSSPTVSGGQVLIAGNGGRLDVFDAASGVPTWSLDLGGDVGDASPLVAGSSVYITVDGSIAKVDRNSGSLQGTLPLTDPSAGGAPADMLDVQRACSSLALVGGQLVGLIRFDYSLDHAPQDGYVDAWTLREFAFAVDPVTMTLLWQSSLGEIADQGVNAIPPYRLLPAPVSLGTTIACASSIVPSLQLLNSADGSLNASLGLDAGCQASPIVANARLCLVTRVGTLYAFQGVHAPPAAATGLLPSGAHLTSPPGTLTWDPAADPASTFTVRLSHDGEILQDWDQETVVSTNSLALPPLPSDQLYTWAVRVRDSTGAFAGWSVATFAQGSAPQPPSGLTAQPMHARVVLSWVRSASAGIAGYQVAWGPSGGPLGAPVAAGDVTSTSIPGLTIGTAYTFQVSAVNTLGFVSIPVTVTATPISTVSLGGTVYTSIAAALAAAHAGDTVHLAGDLYVVGSTLQVPAGVILKGVDANATQIQATAAITMIDAATGSSLQLLGLSGGLIGVTVTGQSVTIVNCVIRDMSDAGVDVPGIASLTNNTIVNNTTAGVRAAGRAETRNNIVQSNGMGLVGVIVSKYNDVSDGYSGCVAGEGDLSAPVTFLAPLSGDYREAEGQPSLDAGKPGDDYSREPGPNGYRVNMGAFGNTPLAAFSPAASSGSGGGGGSCGLLGLEAVVFLALRLIRRRS